MLRRTQDIFILGQVLSQMSNLISQIPGHLLKEGISPNHWENPLQVFFLVAVFLPVISVYLSSCHLTWASHLYCSWFSFLISNQQHVLTSLLYVKH